HKRIKLSTPWDQRTAYEAARMLSSAFLSTPGIERLYSGVTNRRPCAAERSERPAPLRRGHLSWRLRRFGTAMEISMNSYKIALVVELAKSASASCQNTSVLDVAVSFLLGQVGEKGRQD